MARDLHGQPGEALRSATPLRRSSRSILANALLVSASLVIGLIALELVLGLTHYRYLTQPRTDYPPGYFVADPDLGADLAANRPPATFRMRGPAFEAFTNQLGCFDHDDPIGDGYVLAVGDSSTWGYAPPGQRWTDHLEMLSGRRILNCGVSGTGPKFQQIKARKTIAKVGASPDVILVLYDTWNDLNDDAVFPGYGVVEGYRGHTLKSLDLRTGTLIRHTPDEFERKYRRFVASQNRFSLTRFLTAHLTTAAMISHALTEQPRRGAATANGPILERRYDFFLWNVDTARYPWVVEAFEHHLDNLRALRRMAKEHGAELVLITDGIPDQGLHGRLREFLAREIPYHLDVAEPMAQAAQGRRIRYHHDTHWNALGNRLAAEIIDQYLRETGLL
jgi:hypothetical protein